MAEQGNTAPPEDRKSYSVYLRIKPADVDHITNEVSGFTVVDNTVVVSSALRNEGMQREEFKFKEVFLPTSSQKQLFATSVFPSVVDVVNGEDALIFCYGATNSGKSYTMQGSPTHPGIIPRVLRMVFGILSDVVDSSYALKPFRNSSVVVVGENERQTILQTKQDILASVAVLNDDRDPDKTISATSPEDMIFDDEVPEVLPPDDCLVGVWVGFYEIYRESVYDLLRNSLETPSPLTVVKDRDDNSFCPDGLTWVPVISWEDAFNVYRAGRRNLQIASTLYNRHSSRSHCVFSVKLIGRPVDSTNEFLSVQTLSLCDLAGNERISHLNTAITSDEKKESLKINKSLLALNQCFLTLRNNTGKTTVTYPSCRDSKLTMIFKKFLAGRGKLTMVANISQDPKMMATTVHILKMTAVAVSTRVEQRQSTIPRAPRPKRFSMAHMASPRRQQPHVHDQPSIAEDVQSSLQSVVDDLRRENGDLRVQNDNLRRQNANAEHNLAELRSQLEELEAAYTEMVDAKQRVAETAVQNEAHRDEWADKCRELRRRELELLSRLHDHQFKTDQLFEKLADEWELNLTEPSRIVDAIISMKEETIEFAREEIDGLQEENSSQRNRLEELEILVTSLRGQLAQAQLTSSVGQDLIQVLRAENEELRRQLGNAENNSTDPNPYNGSASGETTYGEEGQFSLRPVRTHGSLKWLSDEESPPAQRRAATTAKKKRTRKKKVAVPEPTPAPRLNLRRRLLPKAAGNDHLDAGDAGGTSDLSIHELQPSPNSIMRSARRNK